MDEYIIIPNSGMRLYENNIVQLFKYPKVNWVLCKGIFFYGGRKQTGWYFRCTTDGRILPAEDQYLRDLIVVQGTETVLQIDDSKPPKATTWSSYVDIDPTNSYKRLIDDSVLASFITVKTITDRDRLIGPYLINGKLVRVNDIGDGTSAYYVWDEDEDEWIITDLDSTVSVEIIGEGDCIASAQWDGSTLVLTYGYSSPMWEVIT